jgi:hypothetical protein
MDAEERPSRYAVALESLELDVRVPFDEQVMERAASPAVVPASAWDEQRRQARLAGGA